MDRKWYRRMTKEAMLGLQVRSLRRIDNQLGRAPAGTIFVIEHKYNGLSLLSRECGDCGMQFRVSRVSPRDVELMEAPHA